MTAPPMSATTAAAIRRSPSHVQKVVVADSSGPTTKSSKSCSGANHVFKEPVMKEKLKYLRYFRLVTHRKKNGKFRLRCRESAIPCSDFTPIPLESGF